MHDDLPQSRRGGGSDDTASESAFDALGLSALFGDGTREHPVVDAPPAAPQSRAAGHSPAVPVDHHPLWQERPPQESTPFSWFADAAPQPDVRPAPVEPPASSPLAGLARPAWLTPPPTAGDALAWLREDTAFDVASETRPQEPAAFSWFADETSEPAVASQPEPEPWQSRPFETLSTDEVHTERTDAPAFEPAPAETLRPRRSRSAVEPDVEPGFESQYAPTRAFDAATAFDAAPAFDSAPAFDAVPGFDAASAADAASVFPFAFAADSGADDDSAVPGAASHAPGTDGPVGGASDISGAWSSARAASGGGASGGSGRSGGSRGGSGGGSGRGRSGGAGGSGGGFFGGENGPFAGVLAWIAQHPKASWAAGITVAVLVLGSISFGIGAATAPAHAVGAPATASASSTPTVKPTVRPTPSAVAGASKIRTCSVQSLASDGRLGTLEAQVMNAKTGQVLFDRNGSTPAPTASVLKMLTAAAAYKVLGPDYRVATTVVKGSQPGQVVVIGGGDVTLSRLPSGQQSFYTNAPHLDDLANQVKQAWASDPANAGQPITSLVVDASLFGGPVWQPSWDENEERVVEGSTPYMTAFMVDGDRDDPTAVESSRSTDPIGRAASDLADDLGGGISVSQGTAPAGAKQLGQVQSQPVSALTELALTYSDNTIMEELARLVAIKEGAGNTFDAINAGVTKGLQSYGIDETGLYFADGSGLSNDNRVPPSYLTRFMVKVLNREGSLGTIYDGLPVAGQTGTLGPGYDRFQGDASIAAGHVNAKTGWIDNGYTLAGVVHAQDGTDLTFAIFALGDVGDNAKTAIDLLTAGIYTCGDNLSNN